MASHPPSHCCTLGTLHEGEPTGKSIQVGNGIDAYLAIPAEGQSKGAGIVFLTDVIGIWQNSKLLADMFAARGYTTIVPDLFNGDPIPLNRPADFDMYAWRSQGSDGKNPHTPEAVDPIAVAGIQALKDMGIKRIGAAGYCFGAKYVIRHYRDGIDVGYVAHPSFVAEEELAAITGPFAIAAAETDSIFPTEKRHESEEILLKTGQPYQVTLYSGVKHGFAVRGDPKIKQERFAKEQAFLQAVTWFDEWLLESS